MSFEFVFDTYAWVEYFRGTKKGEKVNTCLETGSIAVPTVVLAELADIYARENISTWGRDLSFITAKTTIIDLTMELAVEAGKLKNTIRKKYRTKFGLADGIILATAKKFKAKVLTGDIHFKKIKEAILL